MKIAVAFCLLSLTLSICSCNRHHVTALSRECIKLNDKGVSHLMAYRPGEEAKLTMAIDYFKQALKCDSTCLTAYLNIADAYDQKKDYKKELTALNKFLQFSHNDLTIEIEKAVIFEKLNMLDSAKKTYQLARFRFKDSLATHPKNITLVSSFIRLLALTEGKESALKELDKQISLHPEFVKKMPLERDYYHDFDRRTYINRLPILK